MYMGQPNKDGLTMGPSLLRICVYFSSYLTFSPDGCKGNGTFPFDAPLTRLHLELQKLITQLPNALKKSEFYFKPCCKWL